MVHPSRVNTLPCATSKGLKVAVHLHAHTAVRFIVHLVVH